MQLAKWKLTLEVEANDGEEKSCVTIAQTGNWTHADAVGAQNLIAANAAQIISMLEHADAFIGRTTAESVIRDFADQIAIADRNKLVSV